MNTGRDDLPRSAEDLEGLAEHYGDHDTADEMDDGRWVEPMVTTSLRLPRELFEQLKTNAQHAGMRQTAYIRELLESGVREDSAGPADLSEIREQLDRVLRAVESGPRRSEQPSSRASTQ